MLNLVRTVALSLSLTPPLIALPPLDRGASADSEADIRAAAAEHFATMEQLVSRGVDTRRGFRFRQVKHHCSGDAATPHRIWDGVVRIDYRHDGVLVDMVYLEMLEADEYEPISRRATTFYSFTSGEYTRLQGLEGAVADTVVVEHWNMLPEIVYYALGYAGPASRLTMLEPLEGAVLPDGGSGLTFRADVGADVRLDLDADGTLRQLTASSAGDQQGLLLSFRYGAYAASEETPRPASITTGHLSPSGCLLAVEVWEAIDGDWVSDAAEPIVARGASVSDYRLNLGASVPALPLDRPTLLSRVSSWPGATEVPHEPVVYELPEPSPEVPAGDAPAPRQRTSWFVAAALFAAVGLVALLRPNPKRVS